MAEPERIRLVVLFGGRSAERDVSCVSAFHVLGAVDRDRYEVVPVGITHEGRWVTAGDAIAELGAGVRSLPSPDTLPSTAAIEPVPAVSPQYADRKINGIRTLGPRALNQVPARPVPRTAGWM